MNILYCHRGALGDFVLAMFGLRMLRRKFPDACFVGLGKPGYLRLAGEFHLCDKILDCESAIFADFFSAMRFVPEIPIPDYAVLWLNEGQGISSLLSAKGAKVLLIEPFSGKKHIGEKYFSAISEFFSCGDEKIENYFIRRVSSKAAKIAIIHPGSGSRKKNLDPEFYLSLSRKVEKYGLETKFVFGEVEIEAGLDKVFPEEKRIYPENCLALKNCIEEAAVYIGNDSGPTHLAAFCGVPAFAIFAASDISLWHPLGSCAEYANVLDEKLFNCRLDAFLRRFSPSQ